MRFAFDTPAHPPTTNPRSKRNARFGLTREAAILLLTAARCSLVGVGSSAMGRIADASREAKARRARRVPRNIISSANDDGRDGGGQNRRQRKEGPQAKGVADPVGGARKAVGAAVTPAFSST